MLHISPESRTSFQFLNFQISASDGGKLSPGPSKMCTLTFTVLGGEKPGWRGREPGGGEVLIQMLGNCDDAVI